MPRTLLRTRSTCAFAFAFACISVSLPALGDEPAESLSEAITGGKFSMSLRYRFEAVDDQAPPVSENTGLASTLRTTLRYETKRFRGVSVLVEAQDVSDLGLRDRHNNAGHRDLHNDVRDHPVVADPDQTLMHQVRLRIEPGAGLGLEGGRQTLNLDNQRFVGAVGWRQNHQSFDIARASWANDRAGLGYSYLGAVHRVTGERKPMTSHLARGQVGLWKGAKLTGYGYFLDYERDGDAGLSTRTIGARLAGSYSGEEDRWGLSYAAEFAQQADNGSNPNEVDARYLHAEAAYSRSGFKVGGGFELLGGESGTGAFATPLATLHKFNGWADKFLRTPEDGLVDLYGLLGYSRGGFAVLAVFHDFSADATSDSYGSELDVQLTYKTSWKQQFGAKAAFYRADTHASDVSKYWIWTSYAF